MAFLLGSAYFSGTHEESTTGLCSRRVSLPRFRGARGNEGRIGQNGNGREAASKSACASWELHGERKLTDGHVTFTANLHHEVLQVKLPSFRLLVLYIIQYTWEVAVFHFHRTDCVRFRDLNKPVSNIACENISYIN